MDKEQKKRVGEAARGYAKEVSSFGRDLWKCSGHRIMLRLLDAYKDEVLGVTKAAVVYSLGTGLALAAGKAMAREMGARI